MVQHNHVWWLRAALLITLCGVVACGDDESAANATENDSNNDKDDAGSNGNDVFGNAQDDVLFVDTGPKPEVDGITADEDLSSLEDGGLFLDTLAEVGTDSVLDDSSADITNPSDGGENPDVSLSDTPSVDVGTGNDMGIADVDPTDTGYADFSSTADVTQPWTGPLWDMTKIADPQTANCLFTNQKTVFKDGVLLDVWNVTYTSWESINETLVPITIKAFAARPKTLTSNAPAIIVAHGLGGFAEEDNATSHAARLSLFTLAYTGPGGGNAPDNTSEGLGPQRMGANGCSTRFPIHVGRGFGLMRRRQCEG